MGVLFIVLVCLVYFLLLVLVMHVGKNFNYFTYKILDFIGVPVNKVPFEDYLTKDEYLTCIASTAVLLLALLICFIGVGSLTVIN